MVQWLGFQAFTATARVESLVGELRSCKLHSVAQKKVKGIEVKIKSMDSGARLLVSGPSSIYI